MNKSERIKLNAESVRKVIDKHRSEFMLAEYLYITDRLNAIIREVGDNGQTKTD